MENNNVTQSTSDISNPNEIKLPIENFKIINMDDLKPNSMLVINIDVEQSQKMTVSPVFAKLLNPYAAQLKEKHISVVIMTVKEHIDVISEKDMNAAGWYKKEKSLIVNPFDK